MVVIGGEAETAESWGGRGRKWGAGGGEQAEPGKQLGRDRDLVESGENRPRLGSQRGKGWGSFPLILMASL